MGQHVQSVNKLERREYDVLVVGSGGAGSAAARSAAEAGKRVLMVSKDPMMCSDSKISGGIITVRGVGTEEDTVESFNANIRMSAEDIGDPKLSKLFSNESKDSYNWLRQHGLRPDFDSKTGKPVMFPGPLGGHNLARSIIHENGGLDYAHACWNAVMRHGSIEYLEDAWFLDVYQGEASSEIQGGLIYHAGGGKFISVKAPNVVLACGGLNTMYFPQTDTMKGNTGDAFAIAARAGANLVDMEHVQFLAFALAGPKSFEGIAVGEPATTGLLAHLRDKDGKMILSELMVRTRAECAAVIAQAVAHGRGTENGGCYLDMRDNAKGQYGKLYADIMNTYGQEALTPVRMALGAKAAKFTEPWEVKPTAHYIMGGVQVNEQTEALDPNGQVIAGLFAAGQAMGGLHGANRLGSTSLTECVVFGRRSGEGAAKRCDIVSLPDWQTVENCEAKLVKKYTNPLGRNGKNYPINLIRTLQKSCWHGVGPARTEQGIRATLSTLSTVTQQFKDVNVSAGLDWNQGLINYIEGQNMLFCGKAVAQSALARPVSMGGHLRTDTKGKSSKEVFSVTCKPHNDELVLGKIIRSPSPFMDRFKVRANRVIRIGIFKFLKTLPEKRRDKILVKLMYKNAGELIERMYEETSA